MALQGSAGQWPRQGGKRAQSPLLPASLLMTQALLNSLVESLPTVQLLLLVNYRPEYQHGWDSKTYCTQLRLDPLTPVPRHFYTPFLGDGSSLKPLKDTLIERTAGNPLFLEENVRTLPSLSKSSDFLIRTQDKS